MPAPEDNAWGAIEAALSEAIATRRWSLGRCIGEGGMGRVYAVRDAALSRPLALKVARGDGDGFAWRRLRREARLTAQVSGAGVASVIGLGELSDGRPWFVMSRIEGEPLSGRGLTEPERLARVDAVLQVARVVARAHRRGLIHRDLKAANLLVADGSVTVLDWGLSRAAKDSDFEDFEQALRTVEQTQAGVRVGTPGAMSPEQAAGQDVDARADVWALGVLLWELLAGRAAYPGERAPEVVAQVLAGPPPMAELAWAGAAIGAVAQAALAPLAERYPDAGAFADALALARTPTPTPPPTRSPGLSPSHSSSGSLAKLAGGLLLGGLLGGLLARALTQSMGPSPEVSAAAAEALTQAAFSAAEDHQRYRAELLALEALEAGGPESLRGLLLSPMPRPVLELEVPAPHCEIGELLDIDARRLACATTGETSLHLIEEDGVREVWRQPVEVHQLQFQGDDIVQGIAPDQDSLLMLSAEYGSTDRPHMDLAIRSGTLAVSRSPDAVMRLGPGRRRLNIEGKPHVDERPSPCGAVFAAAILADGSELHACSDALIQVDAETQTVQTEMTEMTVQRRWAFPDPDWRVSRMRLGADARWVVLLTADGRSGVIELSGETETWFDEGLPSAAGLSVSRDGEYVAMGSSREAIVWEREHPETLTRLPMAGYHVGFDAQNRLVLTNPRRVQRWRLPDTTAALWDIGGPVAQLAWGAGGLSALRADGVLLQQGAAEVVAQDVRNIAAAPDLTALAVATREQVFTIDGDQRSQETAASCPNLAWLDADTLVCGPRGPGPLLITPATGEVDTRSGVPGTSWYGVTSGGGAVALLEWSGAPWVVHAGIAPRRYDAYPWATTLALSADGQTLAITGRYGISLLNLDTGTVGRQLPTDLRHMRAAFSPDGRWLAAATLTGRLDLYRVEDGALAARHYADTNGVIAIAWSPDGRRLALGGSEGVVSQLDLAELDRPLAEVAAEIRAAWGQSGG